MEIYEPLKSQVETYLTPEQNEFVAQAYRVARDAHATQKRASGEPYITHPVAVALILANMKMDHETLAAALLHDVIEDTETTREDLAEEFGSAVADIVEGVSKLDKLQFGTKKEAQLENYRKMIMAMTRDIRVIIIKLADRTHNMRTIDFLRPDKRRRIARETLEIYAPLAHRLGIHAIKDELETLSFQGMYPWRSKFLQNQIKLARASRSSIIERTQKEIENRLEQANIQARVMGREKQPHSIYEKMKRKELQFHEIMDIFAFRIIVDTIDNCYRVLGVVHNLYTPIETLFKDYIGVPKTNGYQSLHTSLKGPGGVPVEIQIRTEEMDLMANRGVAAHWLYKTENGQDNSSRIRAEKWLQNLIELHQSAGNSFEFVESVKQELFPEEIYVFTPTGDVVELPQGATPVDFAFALHTDIGKTCIAAKVNSKPFSLGKALETGQTVEVITAEKSRPNASWLNTVVTGKARAGIRHYIKSSKDEEAPHLGERLLRNALHTYKFDDIAEEDFQRVAEEMKLANKQELLYEVGLGNLMPIAVARRLLGDEYNLIVPSTTDPTRRQLPIKGTDGLLVSYAKCCGPIRGDDIIAHVSPGKGLVIHRRECGNVRGYENKLGHYFVAQWDASQPNELYSSAIRVEIINYQGALARLTAIVSDEYGCDIRDLTTRETGAAVYEIDLLITVRDRKHLADVMRRIRKMQYVQRVLRLRN